jgi:FKBP-type peptidyl-prolyl cis-trans isomerase (trigger factor)
LQTKQTIMKEVTVRETDLQQAAQKGMDAYIQVFVEAIHEAVGEELTAETMSELNADQITLLAYCMLR